MQLGRKLPRRVRRALLAVSSIALVAGATAVATASGAGSAGGTVVIRMPQDWPTFDVHALSPSQIWFLQAAYDRLVEVGRDGKPLPYLATSWKQTAKAVTFNLRQGATCADGTPVTPKVVQDSFQRLITVPKTTNTLQQDFGPGPYAVSSDAKKWTFTLRVGTPYSAIMQGFSDTVGSIVCPAGLQGDAIQTKTFGSGAYTLVSAEHANQIVFKLRPDYRWGPAILPGGKQITAKDLPDTQIWKTVSNDTTAANLLLSGDLTISQISGPDQDRLLGDKSFTLTKVPIYTSQNLLFNLDAGKPTAAKALRLAMMAVIDPQSWNQASLLGRGVLTTSWILPGEQCYDGRTKQLYPGNKGLDAAKKILTDAGYKGVGSNLQTPDGQPVSLKLVTFVGMGAGGEYLQAQFQKLGIDVNLQNLSTTYGTTMLSHQFDVAAGTTSNTSRAPIVHMGFYCGPRIQQGGQNLYGPLRSEDPVWARSFRLAGATTGAESCKWYAAAQERTLQQAYFMPMAAPTAYVFAKGYTFLPGPRVIDPITIRAISK
jgi:peptide/nickel transport system substrate-binding protein